MNRYRKSEHGFAFATALQRCARRRHDRLSMTEMLAELDQRPDPDRFVYGYQVKVGSERQPFWLNQSDDHYEVTESRPFEPPFGTEGDARRARSWFQQALPGIPTLCEPVYTRALLAV